MSSSQQTVRVVMVGMVLVALGIAPVPDLIKAQLTESVTISNLRIEGSSLDQNTLTLRVTLDFQNHLDHQTNLWMIQLPPGGSKYQAWVCDLSDQTMKAKTGTMSCSYVQQKFKAPNNKVVKLRLRVNAGESNPLDGEFAIP